MVIGSAVNMDLAAILRTCQTDFDLQVPFKGENSNPACPPGDPTTEAPTTEAPITEATNYAAQVIEAAEAVEAIKAQTKPRVKSSTSITGVTKTSFFALVTGSQSPADLFKESVADTLANVETSDVVITNVAQSQTGSRARKLLGDVKLDIDFVVTVESATELDALKDSWNENGADLATAVTSTLAYAGLEVTVTEPTSPVTQDVKTEAEIEVELAAAENELATAEAAVLVSTDEETDGNTVAASSKVVEGFSTVILVLGMSIAQLQNW
jgi:hypothetical protein